MSKQALAKVTLNLDLPRGPDVEFCVTVRRQWFGKFVDIELPRKLNCAGCSGGGCDSCACSGAVSLRLREDEPQVIRVSLPLVPKPEKDVCLRIPAEGGRAEDSELPRGHLLLTVRPSELSASEVSLALVAQQQTALEVRAALVKRSLIMAGGLILLFIGLLKLSGWL